jgi:hypothetical protein
MLRPGFLCAAALFSAGCDRGVATATRPVEIRGLPTCKGSFSRPIVIRLDRDRSIFEDPFSTHVRIDGPEKAGEKRSPALVVPRMRMRATVRVGLCSPTSVATWDCDAASWLGSTKVDLDARSTPVAVSLPTFESPCSHR